MTERTAVQQPMLKYAQDIGWDYITSDEAVQLRGGIGSMFFSDLLKAQLCKLNPNIVDEERASEILRRLNLLRSTIEGNRDALSWFRGEQSVFVSEEKRERNVKLIDYDHPDNNLFHVTDEWWQQGAVFRNRADVVFLINGIPVAIAETKNANKPGGAMEGLEQIRRYHRETPEMFTASQVFEVTELVNFLYGVTWNTSRKNIFNWKHEQPGDYEAKVKAFFDRGRFLKVLRDYIIFLSKDDDLTKIILRQHQTRAVMKVMDRALDAKKRRGLIWHTQGSGKTLTMITIASKLLRETRKGEKPTILMIVDRNELEAQLYKNVEGYGIGTVKVATSKRDLRKILSSDYRGLIVSMIHKFDDIPANINTHDRVIVLVDEAHRSSGGDLGNYLMGALPNATYIGFTGTPIDRLSSGRGTFKVFGLDDERGYLDKYSIAESIEDGTTVALNYSLAPTDLRVERELLEKEFLGLAEAEGISDVDELNAILDKAVVLKEAMKSPERMDRIAKYVAEHFSDNVEPMGFKAFLVAVDREACALYKKALDKYLPSDYSQAVYSPAHNDNALLREYQITPDTEKQVRKKFLLKEEKPKILIITSKLLTGYDAPILYCMYLDKPMRDHVLLQAIARVNRPYESDDGQTKPYGFVLDFVGVFEKLEKALAFDSDVVESVIQNIDVLERLFENLMEQAAENYLPLTKGDDDKASEHRIEYFVDKKKREEFFTFFKQLQNLYDILSPSVFLRPFLDDYLALAEMYGLIRNAYEDEKAIADRELTAKTRKLLRDRVASGKLELPGRIYQLGPKELAKLKKSDASDNVKILNLRKLLAATVQEESASKPFLLSIGERAEALALAYEDRQLTTQQALLAFQKLAAECVDADNERQELGVDANTFAIFKTVKATDAKFKIDQSREVNELFEKYPDYEWSSQQESVLRGDLYALLQPIVGDRLFDVVDSLLKLKRVQSSP